MAVTSETDWIPLFTLQSSRSLLHSRAKLQRLPKPAAVTGEDEEGNERENMSTEEPQEIQFKLRMVQSVQTGK